jgi:hypothetical protein
MYNLNYNVTNARLNRPVGRPFVPFGRPDPYSASLVLAIPGAIFRQGYINVFNQTNEFDDISGYLKGGSVFNPNTGQYTTPYASHVLTPTGSVGFITGSTTINNFSAQGYNTSLIVSGNTALNVTPLSSSLGTDFNLSKDTPWCMEAWFAYDQTASLIPSGGVASVSESIWYGAPNKQWIGHWFTDNPSGSSYIAYTGWSGRTQDPIQPSPPQTLISGSPAFYYDSSLHAGNPDYRVNATTGSNIIPYVWQHTAITCYPSASIDPPTIKGVVNMYIDGVRVGGDIITNEIELAPATLITILGNVNPPTSSIVNAINNTNYKTGSGLFAQDVRLYNGAAKYTGSSFTPPPSMIVGLNEPYPQYQ